MKTVVVVSFSCVGRGLLLSGVVFDCCCSLVFAVGYYLLASVAGVRCKLLRCVVVVVVFVSCVVLVGC